MPLKITDRTFTDLLGRTGKTFQSNALDIVEIRYEFELDQTLTLKIKNPVLKSGNTFSLSSGNWVNLIGAFDGANIDFKLGGSGAVESTTVQYVNGADLEVAALGSYATAADDFYSVGYFQITSTPEQFEMFFNLVQNSVGSGFNSLIDGGVTRFTSGDISALAVFGTDTLTQIVNKSSASKFTTALLTRQTDASSGNKVYTVDLVFRNWVTIDSAVYQSTASIGSNIELAMLMEQNNPATRISSTEFQPGNCGFENESFNGYPSIYTLDSTVWTDNLANVMLAADYTQESNFEITILGNFNAGDRFNVKLFTIPNDETAYQNNTLSLDENLMLVSNSALIVAATPTNITGNANIDGAQLDLQNVESTITAGVSMVVTGKVVPNAAFKTLFAGRTDDDRKYRLWIEVEDSTKTFKQANRVNVQADFTDMAKNVVPLGKWGGVSSVSITNHNNESLTLAPDTYLEDDVLTTIEFTLPKSTTNPWKKIKGRVIAERISNGDRFVLEELVYDISSFPALPDKTLLLDYVEDRGFELPATSDKVNFVVERNASADTGSDFGVRLKYPFIVRYEDWLSLPNADNYFFGSKTKDWYTYSSDSDWQLKIEQALENEDGEYIDDYNLSIHDYDDWGETPGSSIEFYNAAGTQISKPSAVNITTIKAIHEITGDTWNGNEWGQIHVRKKNGAPQWTASTVLDYSDTNNPLYPLSGQTKAKITVTSTQIIIETRFNPALIDTSDEVTFTSRVSGDTVSSGTLENIYAVNTGFARKPVVPTIPDFNDIIDGSDVEEDRGYNDGCCEKELKLADLSSDSRKKNDITGIALVADSYAIVVKDANGNATTYTPPTPTVCPNDPDAFFAQIEWRDVALLDGFGCYSVWIQSYFLNSVVQPTFVWGTYELKPYQSSDIYNGLNTTRVLSEFNDYNNELRINLTGTFLKDSLRLDGKSGYNKPNTEIDTVIYLDGRREKRSREDFDTYELRTNFMSNYFYRRLRTHVLGETSCWLSDQSYDNPDYFFFDKPVIVREGIEPEYEDGVRELKATVIFEDKVHYLRTNFKEDRYTAEMLQPSDVPARDLLIVVPYETSDTGASITIVVDSDGVVDAIDSTGLTTFAYTVNGGSVTLPFTLAVSDVVAFTFDAAASGGVIKLSGTYA